MTTRKQIAGALLPKTGETLFEVVLSEGLANRNRLPLAHVIAILQRVQDAIRDVGKIIQREQGREVVDGDFGIELLATEQGFTFRQGSVRSVAAITKDVANGKEAVKQVMRTVDHLQKKRPASIGIEGHAIIPKLAQIADIQKKDQTQLQMVLAVPRARKPQLAVFSEPGIRTLEAISAEQTKEFGLSLYGKLRELHDRSIGDKPSKYFWGELLRDNGEVWRARFDSTQEAEVLALFRKHVVLEGDVTYFEGLSPRIDVKKAAVDESRDYEAAFDELYGCDADIYGKEDFGALIAEMRGDA